MGLSHVSIKKIWGGDEGGRGKNVVETFLKYIEKAQKETKNKHIKLMLHAWYKIIFAYFNMIKIILVGGGGDLEMEFTL